VNHLGAVLPCLPEIDGAAFGATQQPDLGRWITAPKECLDVACLRIHGMQRGKDPRRGRIGARTRLVCQCNETKCMRLLRTRPGPPVPSTSRSFL
jgi:hypothetical protein